MDDIVKNQQTSLAADEVIVRAVSFFTTSRLRPISQSPRIATFEGRPPIPWFLLAGTLIGFVLCIVPGIIMYFTTIVKLRRFQNLVVTVNSLAEGTEVVVRSPKWMVPQVERFLAALPPV